MNMDERMVTHVGSGVSMLRVTPDKLFRDESPFQEKHLGLNATPTSKKPNATHS